MGIGGDGGIVVVVMVTAAVRVTVVRGSYSSAQLNKITLEWDPDFILQVRCTIFWLKRGLRVCLDLYAPDFLKSTLSTCVVQK